MNDLTDMSSVELRRHRARLRSSIARRVVTLAEAARAVNRVDEINAELAARAQRKRPA